MKTLGLFILIVTVVIVDGDHMFFGTSVMRPLVYHKDANFGSKWLQKTVENVTYVMPPSGSFMPRTIQGVMAYDMTHTTASANVTAGGLGYDFVTIRMKSERGEKLHYDIYIYA